jgi:hypothetical protein
MSPFGFISDGLDDMDVFVEQKTGDRWLIAANNATLESMEVWNVDEYGDRSYMWEYR